MRTRKAPVAALTEPGRTTLTGKVTHITEFDDSWHLSADITGYRQIKWVMGKPLDRSELPNINDIVNVVVTW